MKRVLKIFLGIVLGLILLVIVTPILLKGTIEEKVKGEINKQVNATVNFDHFSLSLIQQFPDLSIVLEGLSVVNKGVFQGDTLMALNQFALSVDLMSALWGESIEVNSILLDQPRINARVNADSLANWDIVPESETVPVETVAETPKEGGAFSVKLQSFVINKAIVTYRDMAMNMNAGVRNFDLALSGDLTESTTDLNISSSVEAIDFEFDGIEYLSETTFDLVATIFADMANEVFSFKENEFVLNGLALGFDGSIAMLEEGYDLDVKLAAKQTDFKTLLALVPEVYLKDFETITTTGKLALEVEAKGKYIDTDHLPVFSALLKVEDASFKYPDLPKSVEDINIDFEVTNPGTNLDATIAALNKFHFKLGANPFDASLVISTPISNAAFKGGVVGRIDLGALVDVVPLDSFSLKGVVNADVTLDGNYELVEKEMYEEIEASGVVDLTNFAFKSVDFPQGVLIQEANLGITPKAIELKTFKSNVGRSDFDLTGKLENYLAYALKDGILKGELDHYSKLLDSNEFLEGGTEAEPVKEEVAAPVDSSAQEVAEVPKNLDFVLSSKFDKILYDKLVIDDTQGKIIIKDGRVLLEGLKLHLLDGKMVLGGEYNTQDLQKPFVDFDFDASNINVKKASDSFSVVDSIVPVAKSSTGFVSVKFDFNSLMGKDMSPIIKSINGKGNLKSKDVQVKGAKFQKGLVSLLRDDKYKQFTVEDLKVNFLLEEGNLIVEPFKTRMMGKMVTVSGTQSADRSLDYRINMPVTRKEINDLGGVLGLAVSDKGDDVMVDVLVRGTVDDPKLDIDLKEAKKQLEKEVSEEVVKEVEKAAEEIMKDPKVKEAVDEIKDKFKGLF